MRRIITKTIGILLVVATCFAIAISFVACKKDFESTGINSMARLAYPPNEIVEQAKYDVAKIMNEKQTAVEKGIALLTYTAYNTMAVDRYAYFTDMSSSATKYSMRSQYFYLREGTDYYKQIVSCITESSGLISVIKPIINSGARRMRYGTHRMVEKARSTDYSAEEDMVIASWDGSLDKNETEAGNPSPEEPVQLYKRFECTLDLTNAAQFEDCDITLLTDEKGYEYYQLIITTNVAALNSSDYSIDKLSEDTNPAKSVRYTEYTLTYDIWKCGLFRSANVVEKWDGKIAGGEQHCDSIRKYEYSYSAYDCSIARVLTDTDYAQYLTEEEKARLKEQYDALNIE